MSAAAPMNIVSLWVQSIHYRAKEGFSSTWITVQEPCPADFSFSLEELNICDAVPTLQRRSKTNAREASADTDELVVRDGLVRDAGHGRPCGEEQSRCFRIDSTAAEYAN